MTEAASRRGDLWPAGSVAVTGARGQLGGELCRRLGEAAVPLSRSALDITDPAAVAAVLGRIGPRVVVNCAAWTAVDAAETAPEPCFAANAAAVASLATTCERLGCLLVQISTDYVFGHDDSAGDAVAIGRPRPPYREEDPPSPVNVYGASKLAGEEAARRCRDHLVIRTCGLYARSPEGPVRGRSFADTMLVLARGIRDRLPGAPAVLRVVNDQHVAPSYVPHVAAAILRLVATGHRGTFHVVNRGATTWHGFAVELLRSAGFDLTVEAIPSSAYPTAARRPRSSLLSTAKLEAVGVMLPNWEEGVAAYLAVENVLRDFFQA
jgi:dTDP-4-dehydrorhamnose reductase